MGDQESRIIIIDPKTDFDKLKGLASKIRLKILEAIDKTPLNINELASVLSLPQSTIATNVMILENAGLIQTEQIKGKKGTQKICHSLYSEMVIEFSKSRMDTEDEKTIEVEMPIGLYTRFDVSAPCGLCSTESIIGYLDVPNYFLDPQRVKAGLIWFEKGFVEYKFPNNSLYKSTSIKTLELVAELSSEVPGTNKSWLSDISVWVNKVKIGTWTSPGDYGDKRGKLTPGWWKLEGSQYGLLKSWRVTEDGAFIDGLKISDIKLSDLHLEEHHSITVRLGVEGNADHVGGINVFGKGFGNYNQDLILRLHFH